MKRLTNYFAIAALAIIALMTSCKDKRKSGSIYMPDMAYSRAYETYMEFDSLKFSSDVNNKGGNKIYFNQQPVAGTIKRGDLFPYTLPNDSAGYLMSATIPNPIDFMTGAELSEASRLYNINCGICHGEKGTGNGPLSSKIGAIANLTLDLYKTMADGTMYHSINYGKNNMGSYASQLSSKQRWMIIKYVRTLQGPVTAVTVAKDTTSKGSVAKDTTGMAKK